VSTTAEGVREWPILMSGPLVLKAIEDIKTVTRRVPVSRWKNLQVGDRLWVRETFCKDFDSATYLYRADGRPAYKCDGCGDPIQRKNSEELASAWRPSIFMPRAACRLILEVTAHRVEHLQDIRTEDFKREGVSIPVSERGSALIDISSKFAPVNYLPVLKVPGRDWTAEDLARAHFASGWDKLNADRGYGWDKNPEVKVIEFRRVP
jgi:hypothetical protein